ncbi:MAG TPA: dihydropteroate synthase [Acidimicrobiia bacterium]|jgi:dihydropteroate synthase|nr:dihydropteroate synthase [Acidimicrobiia bacterium]
MYQGELRVGGRTLIFGDVTYVMGVINVSPESRNPHTVVTSPASALSLARRYREWGADLVDVGGQSSHFENPTIPESDEIERVVPVVEILAQDGFVVAVDTWKPAVAEAALAAGALLINDTGGFRSPQMRAAVETSDAGVIAVHVEGENPHAVGEVIGGPDAAQRRAEEFRALLAGLDPDVASRLILDPGIAINYRGDYAAYTRLQMDVIRHSDVFTALGRPLLIPIPRKRDIHWVSAYIALALENGADIIRVHDIAIAASLTRLWDRNVER